MARHSRVCFVSHNISFLFVVKFFYFEQEVTSWMDLCGQFLNA